MKNLTKRKNLFIFILSESIFMSGFGFLFPILAIFIKEDVIGGNVLTASIAVTIYLLSKTILRIPISKYCDKKKLHKEFMIIGYFMMSLVPLGYFLVQSIYQLFLIELFFALGASIGRSGWYHLLSQNVPRGEEGSKWNAMKGYTGIGDAIAATLGGVLVTFVGFHITFIIVSIFGILSTILLTKVKVQR